MWLGGHLPSPDPEYFLKKTLADVVVMGEGEISVVEMINAVENKRTLHGVKGLCFCEGSLFIKNEERPLITDIDKIDYPAWDLFPMNYYALMRQPHCKSSDRFMIVLSGRGCIFNCNFCYRMDKGFRARSSEAIIEEISRLKKDYSISYVEFIDDLLMSSVERTISLCEDFIKSDLNIRWYCEGRLNFATPEVLKIMKDAGCVFVNYGIESMDDGALKRMNKALTVSTIIKGVENTLNAGMSPGLNIIFGNIGETLDILEKDVEFLLKYDNQVQMRTIRPVTPYPGSPLYYYAIEKGLLKDVEDFYENKHKNSDLLTVNFTDMEDDIFYEGLMKANLRLMENYFRCRMGDVSSQIKDLYMNRNTSFRGFRQT